MRRKEIEKVIPCMDNDVFPMRLIFALISIFTVPAWQVAVSSFIKILQLEQRVYSTFFLCNEH